MTTDTLITEGQSQQADAQPAASSQTDSQQQAEVGAQAQDKQQADQGQQSQADASAEGKQGQQAEKPEGAPEQYEFKAEEGTVLDPAVIDAYSEVAKELNLTQDAAQKVLDKMLPVMQARYTEQMAVVQSNWAKTSTNDKEFGGEHLNENLAVAKKALENFGSPELQKMLNESGLGNHPEIIRVLYRVGKATSEDKIVTGAPGVPDGNGKSKAEVLYDNTHQQRGTQ